VAASFQLADRRQDFNLPSWRQVFNLPTGGKISTCHRGGKFPTCRPAARFQPAIVAASFQLADRRQDFNLPSWRQVSNLPSVGRQVENLPPRCRPLRPPRGAWRKFSPDPRSPAGKEDRMAELLPFPRGGTREDREEEEASEEAGEEVVLDDHASPALAARFLVRDLQHWIDLSA
jgi:hypothetical protein